MSVKTCRDNSDRYLVLCVLIVHCTEDDVCIITCELLNITGSLVCLDQADITGNVDDHVGSALDRCLKKRAGYSLFYSLECLLVALRLADTDMCDALVCHYSLNICEVKIDKTRNVDQICDSLYSLKKDLIGFL